MEVKRQKFKTKVLDKVNVNKEEVLDGKCIDFEKSSQGSIRKILKMH